MLATERLQDYEPCSEASLTGCRKEHSLPPSLAFYRSHRLGPVTRSLPLPRWKYYNTALTLFFLDHCFRLKHFIADLVTRKLHIYCIHCNASVLDGWSLSQHASDLRYLDHLSPWLHRPCFIFTGLRASWKPQQTPRCVFYSSSLRVTTINSHHVEECICGGFRP